MARHPSNDALSPRPHRSAGQRILLGLGLLAVLASLAGAAAVAWTAREFRSIDREDVLLDRPVASPSNFLIVGSDSRDRVDPDDPDGGSTPTRAPLADTMMVVRIDPEEETVRVLSMPRDLWITLPDGEKGRLNAAYAHGPQDLIDTLRAELDIPINHYVQVDFKGFKDVVDAIGGVPMWFDRAMRDRNSGLDVLHPGCITLDGTSALAFARSRHLQYYENGGFTYDGTGDLGRISRQQVFIRRVLARANDQGYSNPLTMKRLIETGVDNVTLDQGLSVGTLIGIGERFAEFEPDAMLTYTVPATPRTTAGGAAVLDIDREAAEPILELFRDPVPGTTTTTGADGLGSETTTDATTTTGFTPVETPFDVTVLNSSGIAGRAEEVADDLVAAGFEVGRFGNGAELGYDDEPATIVRFAAGHEDEARTVAAELGDDVEVEEADDLGSDTVVVFLGRSDGSAAGDQPSTTGDGGSATTTAGTGATTSTTAAAATTATTTPPVGIVPGDPPEGRSCG